MMTEAKVRPSLEQVQAAMKTLKDWQRLGGGDSRPPKGERFLLVADGELMGEPPCPCGRQDCESTATLLMTDVPFAIQAIAGLMATLVQKAGPNALIDLMKDYEKKLLERL